jgi:hypothetical protein
LHGSQNTRSFYAGKHRQGQEGKRHKQQ